MRGNGFVAPFRADRFTFSTWPPDAAGNAQAVKSIADTSLTVADVQSELNQALGTLHLGFSWLLGRSLPLPRRR